MSDTDFPNITPRQQGLIVKYKHLLNNTGGNDPLELLNDFCRPNNRDLQVNIVRYLLGFAVQSQVTLLDQLDSRLSRIMPGDVVEPRDRDLDPREVARVGGDEVWLHLLGEEPSGPFPLDNYRISGSI